LNTNPTKDLPELIIGLVAPIGVDLSKLQGFVEADLRAALYIPNTIHLSEMLPATDTSPPSQETNFDRKIDLGNKVRQKADDNGIFAVLAVRAILEYRKKMGLEANIPAFGTCHIIRQLKRKEEVDVLRKTYGKRFIQISATADREHQIAFLSSRLAQTDSQLSGEDTQKVAERLIDTDEKEQDEKEQKAKHGQQLGKIYHLGDAFFDMTNPKKAKFSCSRFFRAFFGDTSIGPTKDEFGSYMAKSAALRSVDLSRQVGSAILNDQGDIISLGTNEVPKAGGGNYWDDDDSPKRDVEINRISNKDETQRILHNLLAKLKDANLLAPSVSVESLMSGEHSQNLKDTRIHDITEFGRMTHAEMTAICDAARLGRPLKGATIFVTTFPCHNCAKHIIASGICRVVYIEPYDKSHAANLHSDAISFNESQQTTLGGPKPVRFEHFVGIAPSLYRNIFEKGSRKAQSGGRKEWIFDKPFPLIYDNDNYYTGREKALLQAKLMHLEKLNK